MIMIIGGAGRWGQNLVRAFSPLVGGKEYMLLADPVVEQWAKSLERLAYARATFKFVGTHYDRLFGECNAVVIATPPKTHYAIAKESLEAGKHVLVEKPLTLNAGEAQELLALARQNKRVLMVDDTWLYHDRAQRVIRPLRLEGYPLQPEGKPDWRYVYFEWSNPREQLTEEGLLWTQGPHPVSLALSLLGSYVTVRNVDIFDPRHVKFTLRSDVDMSFHASIELRWDVAYKQRSFYANLLPYRPAWQAKLFGTKKVEFRDRNDSVKPRKEPLTAMAEAFLRRVQATEASPNNPYVEYHAYAVVRVLEQVQQLARIGSKQ